MINTAANGSPFKYVAYYRHHRGGDPPACGDTRSRICVTLGIPPTWHVDAARWHLPAVPRADAAKYVDAYLWFGRPWLTNQAGNFELSRALPMSRTTPYRFNGTPVG